MSKLASTGRDPIDNSLDLARKRILDLNREVIECRACQRLVKYRESVARTKKKQFLGWSYWGRPVPGFGDTGALFLVIGLAPAPHGGNRTGRVFTGDRSADFLMKALFASGNANQPRSIDVNDGLKLSGVYMTAAVKCAPPDNKPAKEEMLNCAHFLESELEICDRARVILCLGQFAYYSTMTLLTKKRLFRSRIPKFHHGLEVKLLDGRKVFASYHPSPRNTQTGTLTVDMFRSLLSNVRKEAFRPS